MDEMVEVGGSKSEGLIIGMIAHGNKVLFI